MRHDFNEVKRPWSLFTSMYVRVFFHTYFVIIKVICVFICIISHQTRSFFYVLADVVVHASPAFIEYVNWSCCTFAVSFISISKYSYFFHLNWNRFSYIWHILMRYRRDAATYNKILLMSCWEEAKKKSIRLEFMKEYHWKATFLCFSKFIGPTCYVDYIEWSLLWCFSPFIPFFFKLN